MKRKIVFTGGGSAGHVTPNMAIMNELDKNKWDIQYIGSKNGIEKELIEKLNVPYHAISSGKLRRYMSFENIKDIFKVAKGCFEARSIIKKIKPDLIFSKGGFVSVPVIVAASSLKIPIYIHESDMTPGLANKISQRFASKIFTSFEEAKLHFPSEKTMVIGSPIRNEILKGSAQKGRAFLGFHDKSPILTIMGGSLGAKKINETVRASLDDLESQFQIVHLCGKDNLDASLLSRARYKQYEYVHDELSDILAATDFIITRGGSNAIFEFLALRKPMMIIPLSKNQSRGDQILNAKAFEEKGYAIKLEEENLDSVALLDGLKNLMDNSDHMKEAMAASNQSNALNVLVTEINRGDSRL
ncbi:MULTISPECIES: undecaprenyldiphospho-muramoylpentapeptide beta-N-acetylglucosaminyltransferase [unclassified Bacillus (in: firmicutes)]|uniref:undecaprenyldiphospho-muramoylpentapeptide beta-N-acetylglucosaminyltransferase n=1 Tax=unclassified Bacillus (in: firmicutes) TaxID=185979 RepID=UPI0008ED9913|nr:MULTISPECIES: undecaprenyldiphospho-muramoylpentapeptide beta-N-acetylglucosaminyltransferase [unclassified Bacillus (in: firmicutes)]SFA71475.1 UDP-N-acetylglucosamine-N-acetylmuramylpentapeptide N-acetylglucosamine transferase [Bacillus sp. UNCCL13]SFQ61686.1 UDP-N-acetylglucosamine-N-acetylmuramylpentapeptide N-acetylglucosamine transferase [Bacillus sp. cl95]